MGCSSSIAQQKTKKATDDDYGREIRWVDYTNHGYGNIGSPDYHTVPHWHERIYDTQNRDGMKVNHHTDTNTPLGGK